jgi:lipopolysaccharide assembly outer membrane protein LptD (OstA)
MALCGFSQGENGIDLPDLSEISSEDKGDSLTVPNTVQDKEQEIPDAELQGEILEGDDIAKEDNEVQAMFESPVKYNSKDSMAVSMEGGQQVVYLYGGATVEYGSINLEADFISVNFEKKEIYATGLKDSLGVLRGIPKFTEGSETFDSETLRYNFETGKGFAENIVTEQQDGIVRGEKAKMMDKDTYCMVHGKYSTCDADHPHFYMSMTKGKVLREKAIITGRAYLVIEDFPIYFPFLPYGFIPTTNKSYSSGVIIPSYGEERMYGFYLRDGGFYWAASDYFDFRITGDIYSKGKWGINAATRYRLRYKFNGNFSFSYSQNVTGERGIDQKVTPNFSVRLSHSQDAKANPSRTLSASIDFSTSGFSKENEFEDADRFLQNSKSSSVSYRKDFLNTPFSMSANMRISQNTRDSTLDLSLPSVNINMKSIYPFKKKNRVGAKKIYEDVKISYSAQFDSRINTKEYLLLSTPYSDWKKGIKHNIPLTLPSMRLFNHINIVPSVSYNMRWYFDYIEKYWIDGYRAIDNESGMQKWIPGRVETVTQKGFRNNYDFSGGVSSSTTLYGMYNMINPNWRLKAIRHKMDPSIGFSYRPDFSDPRFGFYDMVQIDSLGNYQVYNMFEGAMYGSAGKGRSGSINFSLNNNIEMKLENPNDTTGKEQFTKVAIFDNLGFSSSYNLAADSLNLSNFSLNARTKIAGYAINISGVLDPYALDERGRKYNRFMWNEASGLARLGRITSLSTGFSLSYSSDRLQKAIQDRRSEKGVGGEEPEDSDDATGNAPEGYVPFNMPWRISANYTFNYSNPSGTPRLIQSVSVNGSLDLTPKWSTTFSTGFDFVAMALTHTKMGITRDLHCWSMSFDFSPVSTRPFYTFTIRANAAMLKDLQQTIRDSDFN